MKISKEDDEYIYAEAYLSGYFGQYPDYLAMDLAYAIKLDGEDAVSEFFDHNSLHLKDFSDE